MEGEIDRMSPEFALVTTLESVPILVNKVSALQPKKDVRPPFAFYISDADDEDRALDGDTGLQRWTGTLHLVGGTLRGLQLLCARTKKVVRDMRGGVFSTPPDDADTGPRGRVLIEDAVLTQSSPDLYESSVGYYRRMYTVRLDFQTEEVFDDDD
jgi:hypothetical protein